MLYSINCSFYWFETMLPEKNVDNQSHDAGKKDSSRVSARYETTDNDATQLGNPPQTTVLLGARGRERKMVNSRSATSSNARIKRLGSKDNQNNDLVIPKEDTTVVRFDDQGAIFQKYFKNGKKSKADHVAFGDSKSNLQKMLEENGMRMTPTEVEGDRKSVV